MGPISLAYANASGDTFTVDDTAGSSFADACAYVSSAANTPGGGTWTIAVDSSYTGAGDCTINSQYPVVVQPVSGSATLTMAVGGLKIASPHVTVKNMTLVGHTTTAADNSADLTISSTDVNILDNDIKIGAYTSGGVAAWAYATDTGYGIIVNGSATAGSDPVTISGNTLEPADATIGATGPFWIMGRSGVVNFVNNKISGKYAYLASASGYVDSSVTIDSNHFDGVSGYSLGTSNNYGGAIADNYVV